MFRDPIVEEIHRYRQAYAKKFNNDMVAIGKDLQERQKKSGRKVVSLQAKRKNKSVS